MSADFVKVYRVGLNFTVKATAPDPSTTGTVKARFEWSPYFPGVQKLSIFERGDYKAAMDDFPLALARHFRLDVGEFQAVEQNQEGQ